MTRIDFNPDADLDRVAGVAIELTDAIREDDPRRVYTELLALCERHPAKAAQVLMCFAAWFDPNVSTQTLWARVESITQARTLGRTA